GPHLVALEHLFQLASAALGRTGEVQVTLEDGVEIERPVSHLAQALAAGEKALAIEAAGGRDDADGVAGLESWRGEAFHVSCFTFQEQIVELGCRESLESIMRDHVSGH